MRGETVSWRFNSREKRLRFALPKAFGGRTYDVSLAGGYTFCGMTSALAAGWDVREGTCTVPDWRYRPGG